VKKKRKTEEEHQAHKRQSKTFKVKMLKSPSKNQQKKNNKASDD
jgi:hypothetical protein